MQPDLEKLADRDEEHGISRFFEVKTVLIVAGLALTPLKRGVNEGSSVTSFGNVLEFP